MAPFAALLRVAALGGMAVEAQPAPLLAARPSSLSADLLAWEDEYSGAGGDLEDSSDLEGSSDNGTGEDGGEVDLDDDALLDRFARENEAAVQSSELRLAGVAPSNADWAAEAGAENELVLEVEGVMATQGALDDDASPALGTEDKQSFLQAKPVLSLQAKTKGKLAQLRKPMVMFRTTFAQGAPQPTGAMKMSVKIHPPVSTKTRRIIYVLDGDKPFARKIGKAVRTQGKRHEFYKHTAVVRLDFHEDFGAAVGQGQQPWQKFHSRVLALARKRHLGPKRTPLAKALRQEGNSVLRRVFYRGGDEYPENKANHFAQPGGEFDKKGSQRLYLMRQFQDRFVPRVERWLGVKGQIRAKDRVVVGHSHSGSGAWRMFSNTKLFKYLIAMEPSIDGLAEALRAEKNILLTKKLQDSLGATGNQLKCALQIYGATRPGRRMVAEGKKIIAEWMRQHGKRKLIVKTATVKGNHVTMPGLGLLNGLKWWAESQPKQTGC